VGKLEVYPAVRKPELNAQFLYVVAGLYERMILKCILIKRLRV
jgi:hypothetical protein